VSGAKRDQGGLGGHFPGTLDLVPTPYSTRRAERIETRGSGSHSPGTLDLVPNPYSAKRAERSETRGSGGHPQERSIGSYLKVIAPGEPSEARPGGLGCHSPGTLDLVPTPYSATRAERSETRGSRGHPQERSISSYLKVIAPGEPSEARPGGLGVTPRIARFSSYSKSRVGAPLSDAASLIFT
jgi:hypothetical protein